MKEQLILFKTAKIAKEKGFNLKSVNVYFNGELAYLTLDDIVDGKLVKNIYFAPTQALLQKWLRQKHTIDIEIRNWSKGYVYLLFSNFDSIDNSGAKYFDTYEKALEKGLLEALKTI